MVFRKLCALDESGLSIGRVKEGQGKDLLDFFDYMETGVHPFSDNLTLSMSVMPCFPPINCVSETFENN